MWTIYNFNKWNKEGRPINENVIELDISYSNIEILGNLENLINVKELYYYDNFLTSSEGIENNIRYDFVDSDDYIELNDLFENLIKYDDNIENIERMINKLYGFQKCILK
jgi:hypothetical protein